MLFYYKMLIVKLETYYLESTVFCKQLVQR